MFLYIPDLNAIAAFAQAHPQELIILDFGNGRQSFIEKSNDVWAPKVIMSNTVLDRVSDDIILTTLGEYMLSRTDFEDNSTIDDILATGRNIMLLVVDPRLLTRDTRQDN